MRRTPLLLAMLFTMPGLPSAAAQDDEQTVQARALFNEGIELIEQRQFEEATRRFRRALALRDAPAVRYNLALCLYEMGQYPEAEPIVDELVGSRETPRAVKGPAETLRNNLRERAGRLLIESEALPEGARVAVDGFRIAGDRREVRVAPGTHVITAVQGERVLARQEVSVGAGERAAVQLQVGAVVPPPEEVADDVADDGPDLGDGTEDDGGGTLVSDWRLWAGVGGGVVLITIIILAVALSGRTQDPVRGDFEPGVIRW